VISRHRIRMETDSRASEFSPRPDLGHLVIVLIDRRARRILLRRRHRRVILRAWGDPIRIVSISSNSGVLIVSPLVVGLVRLTVVVSIVVAIRIMGSIVVRIVVSGVVVPAIPLVELATVLLLLLWGTSVVVPGVRVVVFWGLSVSHLSW